MKGMAALNELLTGTQRTKACIKVHTADLDNTLWGGVISEDGVEESCFNHKEGARYYDTKALEEDEESRRYAGDSQE